MSKQIQIFILVTCCLACLVGVIGVFIAAEQFESERKKVNLFNDGVERPSPEVICLPRRWVGYDKKGVPVCM